MDINYLEIKKQIKEKLSKPIDFEDTENLLELGLSSLVIMRLVNQWRKQGIKVSFGSLMEHPTFQGWWELIQKASKKTTAKKSKSRKEKNESGDIYQEFPLTDVQYAYWVGRDDGQALGGVGCHAYLEFDGESVDPEHLQSAWNIVQYHHSMLRDCFPGNGLQKIMSKPYSEKIRINDFSSFSEAEAEKAALSVRDRISHRKLQIEQGEVAGIELTLLPQRKTRVHIDIDLLVADVQSLHIILRDLATAYNGGQLPDESKAWNFAAYLQEQEEEESDEREQAKAYWKKRLDVLPKGPELPMAKRPEEIRQPIFKRRIVRIGKEEWERLQARAKEYKTTPAMLLLTIWNSVPAFVEMLVEYEEYRKLGINQNLRLILMSGDWIPVSLPDRVRGILQTVKMEALGGATEASIWSNCYKIPDTIPENWKSIPYGKPLANQKYYILNQNMENCPNWVPGNLYIAGEGIALGYLNDEEKSKEKFIIWQKTGEKLYSTGDMGRYWSDGNIEFLGRTDNQIKINGYRVETGEIENALYTTSLVKKCLVSYENDKLCAYITKKTESINAMDLQEQLSKILGKKS